jgi:hypothetical protein
LRRVLEALREYSGGNCRCALPHLLTDVFLSHPIKHLISTFAMRMARGDKLIRAERISALPAAAPC